MMSISLIAGAIVLLAVVDGLIAFAASQHRGQ